MSLYNRHLHTQPEWSDTDKVPFQKCICHPLYHEYLLHGREYIGDFPSYLLRCAVFFLSFFPRHIRDFLRNTLFLRSVNRSMRNSVLHSFLFVFVLLWQDVLSFCPIRRYFLLGDKNSIQYHAADSHAAAFSTGSLSLRYTALLLPMDPLMIFTFISGWKEFFDCFSLLVCQTTFVMTPTEFRKSQG